MDQQSRVKAANVEALTKANLHTLVPNHPLRPKQAHKLVTYTTG